MAVERRKVFVDFASKNIVKINTPYRGKDFDVDSLTGFELGVASAVGDIIDLWNLSTYRSDVTIIPPLFAYITVVDPADSLRGRMVTVAVQTSKDNYNIIAQLGLGQSQLIDVKVIV